jgi:hypothetical protein
MIDLDILNPLSHYCYHNSERHSQSNYECVDIVVLGCVTNWYPVESCDIKSRILTHVSLPIFDFGLDKDL